MKRLPIYILIIAGYTFIIVGMIQLYNGLSVIKVIDVPATQEYQINIIPAIVLSVFGLIIALSIGIWLITELWKYLWTHKTLLPIPFILIALGFLNLGIRVMEGVRVMIETNAQTFNANLTQYINAFNTLGTWTIWGICFILGSVVYSVLLKRGIIFKQQTQP